MITKESLFREIVEEVEKVSRQGMAGYYIHQVPDGINYAQHWPIMAAVEVAIEKLVDAWKEGFNEGWDSPLEDSRRYHSNPYEEVA